MGHVTTVEQALAVMEACEDNAQAKGLDCDELAQALRIIAAHQYETRPGISMKGVAGAPDWKGYETGIWKLSEKVRALLKKRLDVRGKQPLLDVVAELAQTKRYGKGRQNLVLLLGEYGKEVYGDVLGRLLSDDEVYGHALKALQRARIGGFADRAREIAARERTGWIRTAARKYGSSE